MSVLRILRMGHPHLRRVADPLPIDRLATPWFERLLQDLQDTLADYGGVGLAAPQVNVPWRVAIIKIDAGSRRYGEQAAMPLTVFVNPTVEVAANSVDAGFWEGCLSVPGLRGYVRRPQAVIVRYHDESGTEQSMALSGFPATVVQHEFDHLDGHLYIDRIEDPQLLAFDDQLDRHLNHWQGHPLVAPDLAAVDPS